MVNDYFFDVIFVLDCILSRVVCGRNSSNDSVTFSVRIGTVTKNSTSSAARSASISKMWYVDCRYLYLFAIRDSSSAAGFN
jgi:hypothetical protein